MDDARARKRSLSRKRSNDSLASVSTPTQVTPTLSREQKCAPYRHPFFERRMKDCGSYMTEPSSRTTETKIRVEEADEAWCQQFLRNPQAVPKDTLFTDDVSFKSLCNRMKGEIETKIVHRISPFIIPSAEVLTDKGAKHLAIVRESLNTRWTNAEPFMQSGPQPQPDFASGFDRDAFSAEQLQKLQPFLGDLLSDYSLFAATYQMYFPFLTCEVKCGAGGLDIADRQNAYAQSILLRGLYSLFRLIGRETELDQRINGFSISHNDAEIRIWGHYIVLDGKSHTFHRHLVSNFIFVPSGEGDQRWKAWTFVMNLYDLWLPDHFTKICSAIDMLPTEVTSQSSGLPKQYFSGAETESMRSDLSQPFEDHGLHNQEIVAAGVPSGHLATPEATIETATSESKSKKQRQ